MPLNPSTLEFWPESDDSEYEDSDDYSEYLEEQNLSADGLQDATSSEARQRSTLDHNLHHTSAWKTTPELGYKQVCVEIISTKKLSAVSRKFLGDYDCTFHVIDWHHSPPSMPFARYRNNLTALSHVQNYLFIASVDEIHIFQPSYPSQNLTHKPWMILKAPRSIPGLRDRGYIMPTIPFGINHLIVGNLGDLEVLISATDNGYAFLWYTSQLNDPNHDGLPNMHFDVNKSAWGLSVHQAKRLLAVSSNSHSVFVFELGVTGMHGRPAGGPENPIILDGLHDNIPSVSFLQEDPSGRWVCATAINGRTIMFDLCNPRRQILSSRLRPGWSVQFVSEAMFKWTPVTNPDFKPQIKQNGFMFDENDIHLLRKMRDGRLSRVGREVPSYDDPATWTSAAGQTYSQYQADFFEVTDDRYKDNMFLRPYMANLPEVHVNLSETERVADWTYEEDYNEVSHLRPKFNYESIGTQHDNNSGAESALCRLPLEVIRSKLKSYPPHATIFVFGADDMAEISTQPILRDTTNATWNYMNNYQTCDEMFPSSHSQTVESLPWFSRINMTLVIPSMSLLLAANQYGRVALMRLLRAEPRPEDGYSVISEKQEPTCFTFKEWDINLDSQTRIPGFTTHPVLAGMCASPIQGWQRSARKRKMDLGIEMGSRRPEGPPERWRLVLTYTDGTIRTFELSNDSQNSSQNDESESTRTSNDETWTDDEEE